MKIFFDEGGSHAAVHADADALLSALIEIQIYVKFAGQLEVRVLESWEFWAIKHN